MKHTVQERILASGTRVLLIDVPGSEVVGFEVRVGSGYVHGRPEKYEVPHVMEHLLATQSTKYPGANQFMIEASKNGAYVNASTSARSNGYVYECAAFELDRMLDLLEEQLARPLFTRERASVELENVREELTRNTTSHAGVCALGLSAALLPQVWQTYEARLAQLDDISVTDLRAHYDQTYTSQNMCMVLAGDFGLKTEGLVARLEKLFAALPAGRRLDPPSLRPNTLEQPWVATRDIEQLYYRWLWLGEALDEQARRELAVLRGLLVGGMGARILGEARAKGLAYHVGAMTWDDMGVGGFGLVGNVSMSHARPLFELMARQLQEVADGKVTQDELLAAQQLMVGSVLRSVQTTGDLLSWYLELYDSQGLVRPLAAELKAVEAVTRQAVRERASELLTRTPSWGLVGPVDEAAAHKLTIKLGV